MLQIVAVLISSFLNHWILEWAQDVTLGAKLNIGSVNV